MFYLRRFFTQHQRSPNTFSGENHELSRSGKPKHRVRRMEEIVNWFKKYCPPE